VNKKKLFVKRDNRAAFSKLWHIAWLGEYWRPFINRATSFWEAQAASLLVGPITMTVSFRGAPLWRHISQSGLNTEVLNMKTKPSIVFAHGLWADGSCFSKLIPGLRAEGHDVIAAQNSLDSLKGDVAAVQCARRGSNAQPTALRRPTSVSCNQLIYWQLSIETNRVEHF